MKPETAQQRIDRIGREFDAKFPPIGCVDNENCGYRIVPSSVGAPPSTCPLCGKEMIANPGPSGPDRRLAEQRERERVEKNRQAQERKALTGAAKYITKR